MLLDFFGLRENPFSATAHAHRVYRSPSYLDTLTSLHEGILAGQGLLILVAASGMGKTTLLQDLKLRLERGARTVFLSVLDYEPRELLRCLLDRLGGDADDRDADDQDLIRMRNRLSEIVESDSSEVQRYVLFIDEAQVLSNSALEGLRLLSNSERPCAKSLQMVLAGQPQLLERLLRPELAQFRNRVAVIAGLPALARSEVKEYINYRLRLAGYHEDDDLFTLGAQTLIAKWSRGLPARINALCSNALVAAYHASNKQVDVSSVRKAISIVDFSSLKGDIRPHQSSPRLRRLTLAGSIVLFLTFTAMLSYRWLTRTPAVSVAHGRSASLTAHPVASNSSGGNVVSVKSSSHSVDADTAKSIPELGSSSKGIAIWSAPGKQSSAQIMPADSESHSTDARINMMSEIRRGEDFMEQGHYEQATRAFEAALALGADQRDVSSKIDGARRAEATERRVLQ